MILLHLTDTPAFPEGVQEIAIYDYFSIDFCLRAIDVVLSFFLGERLQFFHVHRLAFLMLALYGVCEIPAEFLPIAQHFFALRRTDFSVPSSIFET